MALEKLPKLEEFAVEGCAGVTFDEVAGALLDALWRGGMPALRKVTLRGMDGCSPENTEVLQDRLTERGRRVSVRY